MYEQSHRDYLRLGYLHHRLPVMRCWIITVITPLPTKPSDKNARELKLANAAITDMQMRQRDVAAGRCANAAGDEKQPMMKLKMMLSCAAMLLLVVVVSRTSAVCQSVREANYRLRRG